MLELLSLLCARIDSINNTSQLPRDCTVMLRFKHNAVVKIYRSSYTLICLEVGSNNISGNELEMPRH